MKATIEEIKHAKQQVEIQVTKLLADFVRQYELSDIKVDVSVTKFYEEGKQETRGITLVTDISVKI